MADEKEDTHYESDADWKARQAKEYQERYKYQTQDAKIRALQKDPRQRAH